MDASGVPTGAVGSSGNLGGGPTQGGAQHGDMTSALGSGGTALGAGQRGGSGGGGVGGLGGGGLGGQVVAASGTNGSTPTTLRLGARRSTFPPKMVKLIPCRGSTNVASISATWG
jgi:hypothetical protein